MKTWGGAALGVLIGLSGVGAAFAQSAFGGDSEAPIELSAEKGCDGAIAESGGAAERLVCRGNVMVAQGQALLTGEMIALTFFEGTQDPKLIEAEGGMRYASGADAISGSTGIYDAATGTITVTGDVIVVQGEQVVTGERLIYNTQTGAISLSAAPGQRVRGLFNTKTTSGRTLRD